MKTTVTQCLERAPQLQRVSDSWRLDTELLLARALHCSRTRLRSRPEQELTAAALAQFESDFDRRLQGEPIAYLCGRRDFWNLSLQVDSRVLIPRPETELLIELSTELFGSDPGSVTNDLSIVDLGTGSGAVIIALAGEFPHAELWATDLSEAALDVARGNAESHAPGRIHFLRASWCDGFGDQRFDLIVSNPPYVAEGDPHLARGDLCFEPALALASGADGLDAIRRIADSAPRFLKPGGWLLLEHGFQQAAAVAEILARNGFTDLSCWQDLAGLDRVSGGRIAS